MPGTEFNPTQAALHFGHIIRPDHNQNSLKHFLQFMRTLIETSVSPEQSEQNLVDFDKFAENSWEACSQLAATENHARLADLQQVLPRSNDLEKVKGIIDSFKDFYTENLKKLFSSWQEPLKIHLRALLNMEKTLNRFLLKIIYCENGGVPQGNLADKLSCIENTRKTTEPITIVNAFNSVRELLPRLEPQGYEDLKKLFIKFIGILQDKGILDKPDPTPPSQ